MREAVLVQKIIKAVKAKYPRAYVRKLGDQYTRGLPDIIIIVECYNFHVNSIGRTLFVEAKTENGQLSSLQERELQSINDAGAFSMVARDVDSVLKKLASLEARA